MGIPLGKEILIKKKEKKKEEEEKKKLQWWREAAFCGNSCFITFVKTSHIVSYVFYKGLLQIY